MIQKPKKPWVILILGIISVCGFLCFAVIVYQKTFRTAADFSALWESTDSISHYVRQHKKWPDSFDQLNCSLANIIPDFNRERFLSIKKRIDINFKINLSENSPPDPWFVRLKSKHLGPEEKKANDRLRSLANEFRLNMQPSELKNPG